MPYNKIKERGPPGKREEIVLREKHFFLLEKLNVSQKFIDHLYTVGILDPDEYEAIIDAPDDKAVRKILSTVMKSGRDAFPKFMDALRGADYKHLADDLEEELKNTIASNDSSSDSGEGNDALNAVLDEAVKEEIRTCISNVFSTEASAIVAAAENDSITDSSSPMKAKATLIAKRYSKQLATLVEKHSEKIIANILTKYYKIKAKVDSMIKYIQKEIENYYEIIREYILTQCSQLFNKGQCLISSIQEIIMDYFSRLMKMLTGGEQTPMIAK